MGLGSQAFGTFPWGSDAVASPSAQVSVAASPTALAFDIPTRTFLQNADGTMKSAHPVDQEVNLALGIESGTIASAKDVGHKLRHILRAGGATVAASARDEVNRVLAPALARKDIQLISVVADTTRARGRIVVLVKYRNLRTLATQTALVK